MDVAKGISTQIYQLVECRGTSLYANVETMGPKNKQVERQRSGGVEFASSLARSAKDKRKLARPGYVWPLALD